MIKPCNVKKKKKNLIQVSKKENVRWVAQCRQKHTHLGSSWPSWSCEQVLCPPDWWVTSSRLLPSVAPSCPSWGRSQVAPPPWSALSAVLGSVQVNGARLMNSALAQPTSLARLSGPVRKDGSLASLACSCSFPALCEYLRKRMPADVYTYKAHWIVLYTKCVI